MPDEDPMSLPTGALAILADHEDAARHAGLHPHTMRRTLETAIERYRQAMGSGDAAAISEAKERAIGLAAEIVAKLAAGAVRLLEGTRERERRG